MHSAGCALAALFIRPLIFLDLAPRLRPVRIEIMGGFEICRSLAQAALHLLAHAAHEIKHRLFARFQVDGAGKVRFRLGITIKVVIFEAAITIGKAVFRLFLHCGATQRKRRLKILFIGHPDRTLLKPGRFVFDDAGEFICDFSGTTRFICSRQAVVERQRFRDIERRRERDVSKKNRRHGCSHQ